MNNNTDTNNIDTNNTDNSESAKRVKNEKQQQATKTIKLQALLPRRRHHHPLEPKIENELDFPMTFKIMSFGTLFDSP
nr:14028_t:CDS:2 [Entrophospora candida]